MLLANITDSWATYDMMKICLNGWKLNYLKWYIIGLLIIKILSLEPNLIVWMNHKIVLLPAIWIKNHITTYMLVLVVKLVFCPLVWMFYSLSYLSPLAYHSKVISNYFVYEILFDNSTLLDYYCNTNVHYRFLNTCSSFTYVFLASWKTKI